MGIKEDTEALRQHLEELADYNDDELARYELMRPTKPPGLYWQLRWLAGRTLRWLESKGLKQPDRWPVSLKHHAAAKAKPLLIWAVGTDREELRFACRRLAEMRVDMAGFVPVLVTDVADFAFFSRLGWLVEYLPTLSGEGQAYELRKARFIARLYRDAPALSVNEVLGNRSWEDIHRAVIARTIRLQERKA
jgi:hypothetical protein